MTNVPDRRRIDTLGSLATLKNFPFRVQEKLGGEGRGLLSDHGPYEAAESLTCATQQLNQRQLVPVAQLCWLWGQRGQRGASAAPGPVLTNFRGPAQRHLRGNGVPFGFTFNEDVVPRVHDVVLHGLLGDRGGLGHCKANDSGEEGHVKREKPLLAVLQQIWASSPGQI